MEPTLLTGPFDDPETVLVERKRLRNPTGRIEECENSIPPTALPEQRLRRPCRNVIGNVPRDEQVAPPFS